MWFFLNIYDALSEFYFKTSLIFSAVLCNQITLKSLRTPLIKGSLSKIVF